MLLYFHFFVASAVWPWLIVLRHFGWLVGLSNHSGCLWCRGFGYWHFVFRHFDKLSDRGSVTEGYFSSSLYSRYQVQRDQTPLSRYKALTIGINTRPALMYRVMLVTFTTNHTIQQSHFFCAERNCANSVSINPNESNHGVGSGVNMAVNQSVPNLLRTNPHTAPAITTTVRARHQSRIESRVTFSAEASLELCSSGCG